MAVRNHFFRCARYVTFKQHARYESTANNSKSRLVGRDLIDLNDYTANEIKDLIWTALDLKASGCDIRSGVLQPLNGKTVGILLKRPCIKTQFSVPTAVAMLGGVCNTFIDNWELGKSIPDIGRFIGSQCDIIFSLGDSQCMTSELANGSRVPVVSILSETYVPLKCLADLMTITERFGRLGKLKLGYVGPHGPLFNTYLTTLPRLGMNMKFTSSTTEDSISDEILRMAYKYSQQHNTEIHECSTAAHATYRADVVATVYHQIQELHISMEMMYEAAVDWAFLHSMPRTPVEVSDDVFNHEQSLTFVAVENSMWMGMAVVLRLLQDYNPKTKRPEFDKDEFDTRTVDDRELCAAET